MEYRKTLLISPNDCKTNSLINYNVDDSIVAESISISQEIYLKEIIGSELFKSLQRLLYNAINGIEDNIDEPANAHYAELLDEYVKPYLSKKSQQEILNRIQFKIRNIGVAKNSDSNIQTATLDEIKKLMDFYDVEVCKYAEWLSKFLCKNKADYKELSNVSECSCGDYEKAQLNKKFHPINLHLGTNNKCGCK